MKAWCVTGPSEPLQDLERPDPELTGTSILLDVSHCGVCHSDVHFWEGYMDVGGPAKVPLAQMGYSMPMVLGHEIVGTVVAVGPEVEGVRPGDRKIVYPWLGCGHCDSCAAGSDHLCEASRAIGVRASGGFGSRVVVPHSRYLHELGNLDPALACTYACSGLTIYSAIKKLMPMNADAPIVLIGAGGLGLSGIAVLRALGHRNIVVTDIADDKLAMARSEGARLALSSLGDDAADRIKAAVGTAIHAVIDLVNNGTTAPLALKLLAKGGKVVQVGMFGGSMALALMTVPARALTIQGSFVGSPDEMGELIALARTGSLKPIPITLMPKAQGTQALEALRDGRASGRIVLVG